MLTFLFIHGTFGHSDDWFESQIALQKLGPYTCQSIVLPAHDGRPLENDRSVFEQMIRQLRATVQQPTVLIGYSLGGRVALHLTKLLQAQGVGLIRALILEGAHPGLEDPAQRKQRAALDDQRAQLLREQGLPTFLDHWYQQPLFGPIAQLPEERAQLEQMNAERQTLVAELNKLQAEARERQRLYDEMTNRFQSLITAGQLDVTLVNGRLMINMPQDILFRSGSADIGRDGQAALTQVAAVLRDFRDRQFQVEGHSDNVPISTRTFPSNWELSAARALSVVHILQAGGVAPTSLSAAGYGEYHPVAPNDSKENRTKNRRIEIVILPNLEELAPAAK